MTDEELEARFEAYDAMRYEQKLRKNAGAKVTAFLLLLFVLLIAIVAISLMG